MSEKKVDLDFTTPEKQATSLRLIADEIEAGRAEITNIVPNKDDPTVLGILLRGIKKDG